MLYAHDSREFKRALGTCRLESTTGTFGGKRCQTHLLAACDKIYCFKQEKLLALDEEDVSRFLRITSLVLSLFRSGKSNEDFNFLGILWVFFAFFASGLFHCLWLS